MSGELFNLGPPLASVLAYFLLLLLLRPCSRLVATHLAHAVHLCLPRPLACLVLAAAPATAATVTVGPAAAIALNHHAAANEAPLRSGNGSLILKIEQPTCQIQFDVGSLFLIVAAALDRFGAGRLVRVKEFKCATANGRG